MLVDFEFYMAVLGFRRVSIGFIAPLSFKWLDSQPVKSSMDPVPIDVHDFRLFQQSWHGFLAGYSSCFGPTVPRLAFLVLWLGAKRCATESYADSWWYHLEKRRLCPFLVHVRF